MTKKSLLVLGAFLLVSFFGTWVSFDAAALAFNPGTITAHATAGCDGCDGYSYGNDGSYYYDTSNYNNDYYYPSYDTSSSNYDSSNNYYNDSSYGSNYSNDYLNNYNYSYDNYTSYDSYSTPSYFTPSYDYNSAYNYNYYVPTYTPTYTTPTYTPPANPTCTLYATPSSLSGPGDITLYWDSSNATSGYVDNGLGNLSSASGHSSKTISQTTTFNATFYNSAGASVHCSTTVVVNATQPQTPSCSLSASPNSLTAPGNVTINWSSSNATAGTIDNGVGSVSSASGSRSVFVSQTTTFTGTFSNGSGQSAPCSVTVVVNQVQNAPTCTLTASPNAVNSGNYTTLSWTTTNANSVSITNIGSVSANGSNSVQVNGTQNYVLTASGAGGSVTCQTTVVVNTVQNAPSCTLTASPNVVSSNGGYTTLSWTTSNATSATLTGVGSVSSSGSNSVQVYGTQTFTLNVNGPGGSVTCQTTVTSYQPPYIPPVYPPIYPPYYPPVQRPVCSLYTSQTNISAGQPVTLSWSSSNASYGTIDNGVGPAYPVPYGSVTVAPTRTTTYSGTFSGSYGSVNCYATISVTGGGGVVLYQNPNNQPLASVFLSQVPYTGFEAGPALTAIFWLAIVLISAFIAYLVAGRGSMRPMLAYVLGGVMGVPLRDSYAARETEDENEAADEMGHGMSITAAELPAPVLAMSAPQRSYTLGSSAAAPAALPEIAAVIESRAHAAGVLMSPESVALAVNLSPERAEALRLFGDILNQAVRTLPREDGWIMLTADRFHSIQGGPVSAYSNHALVRANA